MKTIRLIELFAGYGSQAYKQAGNSIVVDVMVYIFDNLFNDKDELPGQMTIYDYL